MRKYAREVAFSKVYEFILNPANSAEVCCEQFDESKLTDEDKQYIQSTYAGVKANFEEYSSAVAELSVRFKLERLFKVDLAVLTLAMFEISKTDTPNAVCVNEAVELAKKFSSDKSPSFVNGVLAEYIKSKV